MATSLVTVVSSSVTSTAFTSYLRPARAAPERTGALSLLRAERYLPLRHLPRVLRLAPVLQLLEARPEFDRRRFARPEIHAVERKAEAVSLIARNAENFHLHNIDIHEGRALEVIGSLPEPSHVFIGGSDGELAQIIEHVRLIHHGVRVVVACVTLETFSKACELMKDSPNFEAVQIFTASSKPLTPDATMMKANNPVMLLSCDTQ